MLDRLVTLPAGRRARWVFLLVWIVLAVVVAPLSTKLSGVEKNDANSYLPGSAESTRELNQEKAFTPQDQLAAVVVYHRAGGLRDADLARIRADAGKVRADAAVKRPTTSSLGRPLVGPTTAKDGTTAQLLLPLRAPTDSTVLDDSVRRLRSIVRGSGGLDVHVAGPAGSTADSDKAFDGIDGKLLLIAGVVVIVILLVVYRSPFLWLIPVLSAGLSLLTAQALIYLLLAAHAGLTVSGLSAGILNVLVFGAGTDYALLVIARYREELRRHEDKHEAMALALRRTSPAILASAGTVIIALLCLLLSKLNSDFGVGAVGALGIACTLVTMSTLLPTLLVFVGRRGFWPFVPRHGTDPHPDGGFWHRVAVGTARRPRVIWIGTTLALGVLCLGLVKLDAGGLSNADSFTTTPESVTGQQIADAHFPAGAGSPAVIIGPQARAAALRSAATGTTGVAEARVGGTVGGRVEIQATMADPPDSSAAYDTIARLRDRVHRVAPDVVVGGQSAATLDVRNASQHDRDLVIPIVLVVVFVVLGLLLRAIVAPLLLMGTVVLSFAAALGVAAFCFDVLFDFGGADPSFPLYAFIFLVALGIDYNIFLMTRIREETPQRGTRDGTILGVSVTGGVITSAGVVLAATFGALATLPLVQLVEVGFAVAVGVLLDTFIVRSVLVPALTVDIGRWMWWPSRLAHGTVPAEQKEPA